MPLYMARADGLLPCRRNVKLDCFLKRNTERDVFERIRAYEPCVVLCEDININKVFMHVVLSDDSIYLTEYPPRTVRQAVCFRDIVDVELVNDLPDFLSGQERERSQHIRVVYATAVHSGRRGFRQRRWRTTTPDPPWASSYPIEGVGGVLFSTLSAPPADLKTSASSSALKDCLRKPRSASCPNGDSLGLSYLPRPQSDLGYLPPLHAPSGPRTILANGAVLLPLLVKGGGVNLLQRPLKRWRGEEPDAADVAADGMGAELDTVRWAELHLYSVSLTSRIYRHLQSAWHSYIIRSTLMLEPSYKRRCISSSSHQKRGKLSWEQTAHLFHQLHSELLQEGLSLERRYLLIQELHTAAHRSIAIKKLFWRSSDLCPFLVKTLAHTLHSRSSAVHAADRLLLCTLIAQTLSLMLREMEVEPALLSMLTANQGALTARLLLALVCRPDQQPPPQRHSDSEETEQEDNTHTQVQRLQAEYLDAAVALLYEIILLSQEASRTQAQDHFLTVGWVLRTLKPHTCTKSFLGYQAHQLVLMLSGSGAGSGSASESPLGPARAVLLYQRCVVLLACLQHNTALSEHIRSEAHEEFRYCVKASEFPEKLPPTYPISQPAQRLLVRLISLVLRQP